MKLKPLQPDPATFYRQNMGIVDAVVLTHLARCGLQGASRCSTAETTRICYGTLSSSFKRLQAGGYLTEYTQANTRGRTVRFVITARGWQLMTTPAELELYPDAVNPLVPTREVETIDCHSL